MDAEHLIRLRGGWDRLDEAGAPATRVTLPLPSAPQGPSVLRLIRQFAQPPLEPGRDRLWLRLEAVPGVRRIWLDGQIAAELGPEDDHAELEIPVPGAARHLLTLEVDPGASRCLPGFGRPWGLIALVIRSQ